MQELIQKLQALHGLSPEQSHGVLNTVKEFIKEKFPMVGGAVDSLFPQGSGGVPQNNNTSLGDTGSTDSPASKGGSFTDNLEGEAENFLKNKLGGMFGK